MTNDDLDKNFENISLDDHLEVRHKQERKELQAKIQALKKSAGKGDKKKKKEILEEIVRLENDLDKKHSAELAHQVAVKATPTTVHGMSKACSEGNTNRNNIESEQNAQTDPTNRISKAQKRRDKKAAEDKIRQAEYLAQEELNKTGPRNVEIGAIKKLLAERQLVLHPISSDGNCLYNAIRNQLFVTGRTPDDVSSLRNQTADYIMSNKDSLIFYMTNPNTGDILSDTEFERYCSDLRNTPAWGGQIEISALSQILRAPIEVIQASGPPTIQGEGQFKGPNLIITYHRHMYSLGEHYNSTRPLRTDEDESNDENA